MYKHCYFKDIYLSFKRLSDFEMLFYSLFFQKFELLKYGKDFGFFWIIWRLFEGSEVLWVVVIVMGSGDPVHSGIKTECQHTNEPRKRALFTYRSLNCYIQWNFWYWCVYVYGLSQRLWPALLTSQHYIMQTYREFLPAKQFFYTKKSLRIESIYSWLQFNPNV